MSALHIVADENLLGVVEQFQAIATIEQLPGRDITAADLRHADALLIRSVTQVNRALLGDNQVQFVGTATSGFDHIDREYLASRKIGFAHAPGSNANSVVEYVLCAIAHSGSKLEQLLAGGGTVGIVGYGVIGKALATKLGAMGIRHKVYDPWLAGDTKTDVSLDEILTCDVVSLHAELTKKTPWPSYHLISNHELEKISSDCLLINASRGAVIDNAALRARLERNIGPTTVLDVWEGEPEIDRELLSMVALGSAHIAGYSLDGKYLATTMLDVALRRHFELPGVSIDSSVEGPPILNMPGEFSGADLIRHLLYSRYDITADDTCLRNATMGVPTSEAKISFDRLRKNYRVRRELQHSIVSSPPMAPRDLALLHALGCIPFIQREDLQ